MLRRSLRDQGGAQCRADQRLSELRSLEVDRRGQPQTRRRGDLRTSGQVAQK